MSFVSRWEAFYRDHPDVKCETCGFEVRLVAHRYTCDHPDCRYLNWDGLTCDLNPGGTVIPLGNRRRSIFKGFNDIAVPTAIVSAECKCDMKDLMSPCGHSKDCGYMLHKRKVA